MSDHDDIKKVLCEAEADPQSKKSFLVLTTNFGERKFLGLKMTAKKMPKKAKKKKKRKRGTKGDERGRKRPGRPK